jgi:hypothetical protein
MGQAVVRISLGINVCETKWGKLDEGLGMKEAL